MTENARPAVNDFQKSERALVKEWGLPMVELADARRGHLRSNVHYQWRENQIWYSPAGVEEMLRYVVPRDRDEILDGVEAKRQAELARALPHTYPLSDTIVAVERIWANPRLLRCVNAVGGQVTLRVRSNRHFRRGMRINLKTQCVWLGDRDQITQRGTVGYYEFVDTPPRLPGRW